MESSLTKIITGAVLLGVFGFFGYKMFMSPVDGNMVTAHDQDAQYILDVATRLNSVSINTKLFTSPLFASLKDFTPGTVTEPQGRIDPFASFGSIDAGFTSAPLPVKKK